MDCFPRMGGEGMGATPNVGKRRLRNQAKQTRRLCRRSANPVQTVAESDVIIRIEAVAEVHDISRGGAQVANLIASVKLPHRCPWRGERSPNHHHLCE